MCACVYLCMFMYNQENMMKNALKAYKNLAESAN